MSRVTWTASFLSCPSSPSFSFSLFFFYQNLWNLLFAPVFLNFMIMCLILDFFVSTVVGTQWTLSIQQSSLFLCFWSSYYIGFGFPGLVFSFFSHFLYLCLFYMWACHLMGMFLNPSIVLLFSFWTVVITLLAYDSMFLFSEIPLKKSILFCFMSTVISSDDFCLITYCLIFSLFAWSYFY